MLNALESPWNVFDLPALVCADLLALHSAARARPLFRTQLVDLGRDGEIPEVGQSAPSFSPLHPSQFVLGLYLLWNIIRVDGLVLQFLSEVQQYLRQIAGRAQHRFQRFVVFGKKGQIRVFGAHVSIDARTRGIVARFPTFSFLFLYFLCRGFYWPFSFVLLVFRS
jgi:hypothetical protein